LRATYTEIAEKDSAKKFSFSINLPRSGDVEYAPGEFAAETSELRQQWIQEFKTFSAGHV